MKIDKLRLTHFRCFDDLEIRFDPQLTVMVARNGAATVLDGLQLALNLFLSRLPKGRRRIFQFTKSDSGSYRSVIACLWQF